MEHLDANDRKILEILRTDGRISWQQLADSIDLSLTATVNKVKKLEEDGCILGYSAVLSQEALGKPVNSLLFVDLERQSKGACEVFEQSIVKFSAVRFCGKVTGKPDYMAHIVAEDIAEYEKVVSSVSAIPGVARVHSNLLLKKVRSYGPPRRTKMSA